MRALHWTSSSVIPISISRAACAARRSALVCAIGVAILAGCAGAPDDPAATTPQALAADWIHPACSAAALLPPQTDACNGPWTFDYTETWNDPTCGPDLTRACSIYKACTSWDKVTVGDGKGYTFPPDPPVSSSGSFHWSCVGAQCTGTQPTTANCAPTVTARYNAIGAAMAATLTAIEAQAPAILAQGQLTSDEGNAIRSDAWVRVQQLLLPTGVGLAGLPPDLRQLFEGFLEREIASISRRGVMHGIAREQVQLALSADTIAHELGFAQAQNRLLLLVPRWRLRDLSGTSSPRRPMRCPRR